ncbi:uncharacterized protein [Palaemon carinicauda]|uniref:uncharacterized protein n=1 Tax=Palaemon carinicauda TaxID=392227 RepID=UPI0035B60AFB
MPPKWTISSSLHRGSSNWVSSSEVTSRHSPHSRSSKPKMHITALIIMLLLSGSISQDVGLNPQDLLKKLRQSCDSHTGNCAHEDKDFLASEDPGHTATEEEREEVLAQARDSGCQPFTHACVPYYQCIDGVINTSGTGLIDVRTRPLRECTDPQNPSIPGLCCRIPGATAPRPCPSGQFCVERRQCNADGTLNTDGTGIINPRVNTRFQTCQLNTNPDESGVCCKPAPHDRCPNNEVCVLEYECSGANEPDKCFIDKSNYVLGVCCYRPNTDACPDDTVCIPESDCIGEIWDRSRNFAPYRPNGDWYPCIGRDGNSRGVCCRRADACPEDSVCTAESDCRGEIWDRARNFAPYRPNGDWYPCIGRNGNRGVCCRRPDACPEDSVCTAESDCRGEIWDRARNFAPYRPNGDWYPCIGRSGNRGVCCRRADACPEDSECVPESECRGEIWDRARNFSPYRQNGEWYSCTTNGQRRGVCCRAANTCPEDSICIPESECRGEVWDRSRKFAPYRPNGDWYPCTSRDGNTRRVCCRISEIKDPKYLPARECGIRNYRRDQRSHNNLGKGSALFGEFPWQAILFFKNYTYKCGASIIGDRWLITGAHCVNGYTYRDFKIRLGEYQVDVYDEPLPYQDVDIGNINAHPNFNADNLRNDIAVIELEAPIQFQYHINTICLPAYRQVLSPGSICIASGWGKDAFAGNYQAILKIVELPFVEHGECEELLRKTRLGRFFKLHDSFMCAGGEENKDVCTGDGGGPLACKDSVSGKYYLQGITSWGIDCGQKDVPGVYADVRFFSEWIDNIINR